LIASDGRWALKIKPHTLKKLKVIEYYLNEFATSMKPTGRTGGFRGFAERNYIDLFAGPGRCVVSDKSKQTPSGMEVDGSPLIALKVKHPLSKGASPDGGQFRASAQSSSKVPDMIAARRTSMLPFDISRSLAKATVEHDAIRLRLEYVKSIREEGV